MRIVLVGAGLAAQRCAETLRTSGHDGPITMIGAEPHPPYDRPPLSKALLAGERPALSLRPASWHADHDVELWTGTRAVGLGERVRLDTGDTIPYDRLLIATGARGIELPGLLPHAHTLRTLDDALSLDAALTVSTHVAIVGAGLIGQEVASAARARGVAATLIDAAEAPFDALMGPGGGHHLRRLHENAGVCLRLGRRLVAAGDGALRLDDGTTVEADCFLVAVGVRPDTGWTGGYSAPNVYTAGDAAGQAHWEAAARQGAAAARAMLGLPARPEAPSLVWSDQHGVRIQRIGDLRGATAIGDLTYAREGRIAAVVLMNDPGALRTARRSIDTLIQEAA
jgi:NADPH-dependent 2,4-dienoyl-CoA reductase/sulfur reductase-like enzyme